MIQASVGCDREASGGCMMRLLPEKSATPMVVVESHREQLWRVCQAEVPVRQVLRAAGQHNNCLKIIGGRQEFRPPCRHPIGLGDGLTLGTVTVATRVVRVAFEAALRTLLRVAPELRRATGHDCFDHFSLCRRDRMRVLIALAVEAKNVGDFPRRRLRWRGHEVWMDTGPHNGHWFTPRRRRDWRRESTVSPRGFGGWPGADG